MHNFYEDDDDLEEIELMGDGQGAFNFDEEEKFDQK